MISRLATTSSTAINIPPWHWIPWVTGLILLALCELVIVGIVRKRAAKKVRGSQNATPGMLFHTLWVLAWLAVGLALGGVVWLLYGSTAGGQYFASYLLANMLSVDNLAVLSAILVFYNVPEADRHRPIYWGITGAIVIRAGLLLGGVGAAVHLQFLMLILGAWLVYATMNLLRDKEPDVENTFVIKFLKRQGLVTTVRNGDKFFVRDNDKKLVATVLFVVLIAVEVADILMGFDSLAATVAVTQTALIAFTSNVSAVFGLRALFFVFQAVLDRLWALKYGVAIVLVGVAVDTICSPVRLTPFPIQWAGLNLPNWITMTFVLGIFGASAVYSLVVPPIKAKAVSVLR